MTAAASLIKDIRSNCSLSVAAISMVIHAAWHLDAIPFCDRGDYLAIQILRKRIPALAAEYESILAALDSAINSARLP